MRQSVQPELELLGQIAAAKVVSPTCRCASIPTSTQKPTPRCHRQAENKFGIPISRARGYAQAAKLKGLRVTDVDMRIGGQITAPAVRRRLRAVVRLRAHPARRRPAIEHVDLGGGLGIRRIQQPPPDPDAYAQVVKRATTTSTHADLEPGRLIVGNAGILVARPLPRRGVKQLRSLTPPQRPGPPDPLRGAPRDLAGAPPPPGARGLPPTSSARSANQAISWRSDATCRKPAPATCSP